MLKLKWIAIKKITRDAGKAIQIAGQVYTSKIKQTWWFATHPEVMGFPTVCADTSLVDPFLPASSYGVGPRKVWTWNDAPAVCLVVTGDDGLEERIEVEPMGKTLARINTGSASQR